MKRSLAFAMCATLLVNPSLAQPSQRTILPGALDLPVVAGSQLAEDCFIPTADAANPPLTACVTLPMSDAMAAQQAYTRALLARGWRGAGGAANMISFEQPIEGSECSRRLDFAGMPHGTPEQLQALRAGQAEFNDFDTVAFWFVLAREPVCGDTRQARATPSQQATVPPEPSAANAAFAPTGRDGEGVVLPGRLDLPVMPGSFLAENCSHNPDIERAMRMARMSVQCVATDRLNDSRWNDRYHDALLSSGWRLREREGALREYTREIRRGCVENLGMSGNAIVSRPDARQGRRIVDRSAITHATLIFVLSPQPMCAREEEE